MIKDLKIYSYTHVNDEDVLETIDIITNDCPECKSENSLIILSKKERATKDSRIKSANMKICCIRCKWKTSKIFKREV